MDIIDRYIYRMLREQNTVELLDVIRILPDPRKTAAVKRLLRSKWFNYAHASTVTVIDMMDEVNKNIELERYFKVSLKAGHWRNATSAAKELPEPLREAYLRQMLSAVEKRGLGDEFRYTAELLGFKLPYEQLKDMFDFLIGGNSLQTAAAVAAAMPEPHRTEALCRVVHRHTENRYWGGARETASRLREPVRSAELENVLSLCISRKNAGEALATAAELDRDLSKAELELLLAGAVKRGVLGVARPLTVKLGRKLKKGEIERLLRASIKHGWLDNAQENVRELGRGLTEAELGKIMVKCTKRGDYLAAKGVALALGRGITASEIETIIESMIKQGFSPLEEIHELTKLTQRT